jgi:hypothetical protein
MAARTGRLGNVAYKKETTWGTYVAGDAYLRVSTESLNRTVEHTEDPALVSEIYTTDMIKVGDGISGSMEAVMHGDEMGEVIWGVLGGQSSAVNPAKSWLLVGYNGTANYMRLTKSGTSLTAETSSNGSTWVGDTNFSSLAGVLDLSAAANDTLTELTAVIAAKTGYDAVLFGSGTPASSDILDFSATEIRSNDVKVGAYAMKLQTSSTEAKMHTVYPAAATGSLPSFSFTINRVLGADKSVGAVGCKFGSITLTSTAKDLCKYSLTVDGKAEEVDQSDVSVTVPTIEGYLAANMKIVIEEPDGTLTEMDEVKDYSLTINANLDDNRVVGSYYKKEQERQGATIEFSFTANNTTTQYPIRDNYIDDTPVSVYLYWKSNDYADTTNSIPYSIMVRIPDAKLTDYNSPLSTPDRLTITGAGRAVKPTNTTYTKHIYAYIVDGDTSSY